MEAREDGLQDWIPGWLLPLRYGPMLGMDCVQNTACWNRLMSYRTVLPTFTSETRSSATRTCAVSEKGFHLRDTHKTRGSRAARQRTEHTPVRICSSDVSGFRHVTITEGHSQRHG